VKYEGIEIGLDIDPETGTADSGDLEADLSELMLAVAEAASARKIPVALIVDEMQYLDETELSALITAIHRINQKQLPLILVGAGLPQLVGLTGKAKSYAERLFDFPRVGALTTVDAENALQGPARREGCEFTKGALGEILRVTEGYPYFLQEWAYHAWNMAPNSPIEIGTVQEGHDAVTERLDESFFRVRFDRLTPSEKDYLRAMAELPGPRRSGDIAALLGVQGPSVAPRRSGLIKKGMIYSPAHGDTEFTVPMFDQFMKRFMPNWKKSRGSEEHAAS
jgi:AAA domain